MLIYLKESDVEYFIQDINVDRLTFEWGGRELVSSHGLAKYLGISWFDLRQYIDTVDDNFDEFNDFEIMDTRDLYEITGEALDTETEVCYTKKAAYDIISVIILDKVNRLFSPFEGCIENVDFH
jgi:hypothetical protein